MKLIVELLLIAITLAKAEHNNRSKISSVHLPDPAVIPQGLPSLRIVGGQVAPPNSLPYQVGLFLTLDFGDSFCSGSLITPRTVLTAAHCLDSIIDDVEVVLGAHIVTDKNEPTQVRINSSEVIIHPGWTPANFSNDIALVRLPKPVELNGQDAIASGWGFFSDNSSELSTELREVTVPVITNGVCNSYLGVILDTHICTSGLGGKATCSGDSGGPLVVDGVQVGITSFAVVLGCELGYPPVFTRLSSYHDWILSNLES